MKDLVLLPTSIVAARNHSQQLKVIMNLPVRLVSEDQVIDVLPLQDDPNYVPKRIRRNYEEITFLYPNANQLIHFFYGCEENNLLTIKEVAAIYSVSKRTIHTWTSKGLIFSYRLAPSMTFYKKSELPTIAQIYGPYEV
jgi:hypothetical protein